MTVQVWVTTDKRGKNPWRQPIAVCSLEEAELMFERGTARMIAVNIDTGNVVGCTHDNDAHLVRGR